MATDKRGQLVSRFRIHKMKARYWRERIKLGKLNTIISEAEELVAGAPADSPQRERLQMLLQHRMKLIGQLQGVKDTFAQFDISLNRDATPVVTKDQIYSAVDEVRPSEEIE